MTVEERFLEYLNVKALPDQRAEKQCDLSAGTVKNARRGSKLGSDKLVKILGTYTDLSAEWLLRGSGPMLLNGGKASELEQKIDHMSKGGRNRDAAYDIVIGMIDVIGKTYNYYKDE